MEALHQRIVLDGEIARADPTAQLWQGAFEAAYRRHGLAHSPLGDPNAPPLTAEAVTLFLRRALQREGHLVVANGLDLAELEGSLRSLSAQQLWPAPENQAGRGGEASPQYFGGERRIALSADADNHVLIGFGLEEEERLVGEVLASLVGGHVNVPFGTRISHLSGLRELLEGEPRLQIASQLQMCRDGGLWGVLLQAPRGLDLKPVIERICRDLQGILAGEISSETLMAAKAQAAFRLATHQGQEGRLGEAMHLAQQLARCSHPLGLAPELGALRSLSSGDFKGIAGRILSRKPVYVPMGDLRQLPYLEEITP